MLGVAAPHLLPHLRPAAPPKSREVPGDGHRSPGRGQHGRLERHPKTALPTSRIWTKANRPLLRLITCAGSFDRATGHYRDNLIVYASPSGS